MKRAVSVFFVVVFLFSACFSAYAFQPAEVRYPFILVHGMMGWGQDAYGNHPTSYWAMTEENDIIADLNKKGYEAYAPSVGPMSSAWDRACELFAQMTGTVVDYGAAHAAKYGHNRYGRDYTGKGYLSADWYEKTKVNLVGHSFGSPTIMVFASLMAYGNEQEKSASPKDCSPLFSGNHNCVFSVSCLDGPLNGSPLANFMNDTVIPVYVYALMMNIEGTKEDFSTDYMLDQWGLTVDPATQKRAELNIKGIWKIAGSHDHAGYDMSLQGARELCNNYPADTNAYYMTYFASMDSETDNGSLLPSDENPMGGLLRLSNLAIKLCAGHTFGGIKTTKEWASNDGLVPVPSAMYPYGQRSAPYPETGKPEKGVWYYGTPASGNHGYGIAIDGTKELWVLMEKRIFTLSQNTI